MVRSLSLWAFLLVFCPAWVVGCGNSDGVTRLRITGSTSLQPLITELALRYEAAHPGVRIDIEAGGSTRGINDAIRGTVSLGMASRPLMPNEQAAVDSVPVALDGLAIVTHADHQLSGLDRTQITQILDGTVRRWSQIDPTQGDRPIILVQRAEGRGELAAILAYTGLEASDLRADAVAGATLEALRQVEANSDGITYLSMGAALIERARGGEIHLPTVDGVEQTSEAVAEGRYPLVRPLLLVLPRTLSPEAEAFLAFATSPEADDLIQELAFVAPPR